MTAEGTASTVSRRSATRNKKGGCFVGVVRLDELTATNGACLPEQIRRAHSGGNVNMDNATFLRQHAVSTPTGRSSSMPASVDCSSNTLTSYNGSMHHQPQPADPSFQASLHPSLLAFRIEASMVQTLL